LPLFVLLLFADIFLLAAADLLPHAAAPRQRGLFAATLRHASIRLHADASCCRRDVMPDAAEIFRAASQIFAIAAIFHAMYFRCRFSPQQAPFISRYRRAAAAPRGRYSASADAFTLWLSLMAAAAAFGVIACRHALLRHAHAEMPHCRLPFRFAAAISPPLSICRHAPPSRFFFSIAIAFADRCFSPPPRRRRLMSASDFHRC